jgi:hypothetical protein
MSPTYSVLNGVNEDLDSASRKTIRIVNNTDKNGKAKSNKRHDFKEGPMNFTLTTEGKDIQTTESNGIICKNCGEPKIRCVGIGGVVEELIKVKAQELNKLLKTMEASE